MKLSAPLTAARTSRRITQYCALAAALALPVQSQAMNILLTNDDGLTSNLRAMQTALQAAGHDVLISVPCQNQSGKGASINFLTPIAPLAKACRNNAAPAGAPGIGPITGLNNAHYVDGTPIMATMYAFDVLAAERWGKAPDLVLSGPNEGQNLGSIVISSGTVSNAQYALARGIPSIAVSADVDTTGNDALAGEVAQLSVKLVNRLRAKHSSSPLLPKGIALNMNLPKFAAGTSADLEWKITKFGNFDMFDTRFVTNLGADPTAASYGLAGVNLPGVTIVPHTSADADTGTDPKSEALLSLDGYITVTPMQQGYEVRGMPQKAMDNYLTKLLKPLTASAKQ
jgi:5'-nucleotidase